MTNGKFQQLKRYACEFADETTFTSAFPFFCLRVFFSELGEDQIEAAIDGLNSNDESIDAFWVTYETKTMHIAQFKSVESENNIRPLKKETFSFLSEVENKLSDEAFISAHKNKRIREDIAIEYKRLFNQGYSTKKYIFHLGTADETIIEYYKDILYYNYNDIFEKWDEYNSINSVTDPEECNLNVSFSECNRDENYGKIIRFKPTKRYSTIITLLSGDEIIKIRRLYKYQLFDRNVRYYLGSTNKINKEIYYTAKNRPDNFYYFNNGITITCSRCRESLVHDEIRLNLELPQIINGAQTVNAIYEAYNDMYKKRKADLGDDNIAENECISHFKKLKVLCRIIESTKHAEADFSMNLTRFNNSQNSVNISDFYANRPEQVELQKKLLKYGYFYERKRGERERFKKGEDNDYNIKYSDLDNHEINLDLPTLAGAYQAYCGKPGSREVGDRYILDTSKNDYSYLFGENRSDITDEKVQDIVLAINIFNSVESYVKLYNRLTKTMALLEVSSDLEELFIKFKKIVSELIFLPNNTRIAILETKEYTDIDQNMILKRLYNYRLLSQGKYLLTAIIHEILKLNKYKDKLFIDSLFNNYSYINNNITTIWLSKIILKLINPVREKERDKRSDGAFFLDSNTFNTIKVHLQNMIYDDDFNIKEQFPI